MRTNHSAPLRRLRTLAARFAGRKDGGKDSRKAGRPVRSTTPRRVVTGVDGTAADPYVLAWAADEAALRGAELVIVHTWRPAHADRAPYAPPCAIGHHKLEADEARLLLDRSAGRVRNTHPGLHVRTVAHAGPAVPVLLELAADADMLVLGRRRRTDASMPTLGPVTRACVRGAPCPVVTVAVAAGAGPPPERSEDQASNARAAAESRA